MLLGTLSETGSRVVKIEGCGCETEEKNPEGSSRVGLELMTPLAGTVEDGLGGTEEAGTPGTVREVLVPKLEETTLSEEAGDWVGRPAGGSVALKKTVETTVIVTGPSGGGCVGCGVPSVD